MTANSLEVTVNIDSELVEIIKWLSEYKNLADEAFSCLDGGDIERAKEIALRALNVGAKDIYKDVLSKHKVDKQ
jgi:hypothetical protein